MIRAYRRSHRDAKIIGKKYAKAMISQFHRTSATKTIVRLRLRPSLVLAHLELHV